MQNHLDFGPQTPPADTLNLAEGLARKGAGTALAIEAVPTWADHARAAVMTMAVTGQPFTSDDLYQRVGLPHSSEPNDNNAVGALFSSMAKAGIIRATGRFPRTRRAAGHGRRIQEWVGR